MQIQHFNVATRFSTAFKLALFICLFASSAYANDHTIVMISIDGARPDYFSEQVTPNIYKMGQQGWQTSMRPIFPTVTFPNHAALATGCTADKHGIVSNSFLDPQRGHFDMSPDSTWMKCEPVWVTAERAGVKAAIALWPMSWTSWQYVRASYYFPKAPQSDKAALATSTQSRLDQIITWLQLPDSERPRLILSWLGEADHMGHSHGPDSEEVRQVIKRYDQLIGNFLAQLRKLPVHATTDIILVSDHGMATTTNYISVDYLTQKMGELDIVPASFEHSGPLALITLSKTSQIAKVEKILTQIGSSSGEFATYTQKTLPNDWHFRSPRSGQVILMASEGGVFTKRGKGESLQHTPKNTTQKGNHGYPPETPSMQAILFAEGPDFPHDQSPTHFTTIEVAPLIKKILSLPSF